MFRVDASSQMGTGHVYRCLTLAKALQAAGYRCHFVCRELPGHLAAIIAAQQYEITLLPAQLVSFDPTERQPYQQWLGAPWHTDADQTVTVIQRSLGGSVDLLVVDHYGLDARWHQELRPATKRILVLDDLADRPLDADWVLDQTHGRLPSDYQPRLLRADTQILAGAKYALLRPEFAQLRAAALRRRQAAVETPRLLITLGGADPDNLSARLLVSLAQVFDHAALSVDLVIGASNPHSETLRQSVAMMPFETRLHVATPRMAELMVEADLAIGAAGTTSWERCVLGLPTLTLCLAENQREVLANLADAGAIQTLPIEAVSSPQMLQHAIVEGLAHRETLTAAAARITDGLGIKRVMMALLEEPIRDGRPLRVRLAQAEDCQILFEWQCAPRTRMFARNPQVPSWEGHQAWYRNKLADPAALLAFMVLGETPVGMLRLDPVASTQYDEISVLVSPEHYRLGIAEAGLKLLRRLYPERHLLATVLADNQASHGLFQRLGYEPISPEQYRLLPQD
ncbi:UDP-2,4-diacetamido-2,4,6-trideoxy-beta-L-altropyranose hydrolase [Ferrimonas gelatinilytica]|uniref:UDP-2,4-diacetamido-2,4, 6-trideoxy-beta-L-altropyranose hydrolase n=1 Tax=Ferrimonas gelatinilytica TaxID=1255257 RepID=A0ABP9SBL9_9GAMM